jgi:predicted permease
MSSNIQMATERSVETVFCKDILSDIFVPVGTTNYIVVIFNNVTSRNYSLLTFAGSLSLIVSCGRTDEQKRCVCKIREMTIVNPKSRMIAVGMVTNQEAVLLEMVIW